MCFVPLSFSSLPNIFYRHWRKKRQSFLVATVTAAINTCTGINRKAMAVLWSLLECLVMAQLLKRINSNLDLTSQEMQKRMHSCSYPAYLLRTVQCISVQLVNTAIQFPITANKKLFMLHLFDKKNTHTPGVLYCIFMSQLAIKQICLLTLHIQYALYAPNNLEFDLNLKGMNKHSVIIYSP